MCSSDANNGPSRADAHFGNNYVFNQTVFDRSREYWTAPTLTVEMLANSKLAREVESRAFNPTYSFPNRTNEASLLELAAPIAAFGDPDGGTLRRDFLEYFFGKRDALIGPRLVPCDRGLLSNGAQRMRGCRWSWGGLHGRRP